jgi:hypothetical protein
VIFGLPNPLLTPGAIPAFQTHVKSFICPADPTMPENGLVTPTAGGAGIATTAFAATSYAGNIQVFCLVDKNPNNTTASNFIDPAGEPRMAATFPDGTSNTLLFAEKYAHCTGPVNQFIAAATGLAAANDGGNFWAYDNLDNSSSGAVWFGPYHPGFSLAFWELAPGIVTVGPGSVFQQQPPEQNCNPMLASSGHTGGMVVTMADASARVLSPNISGLTWWALCTPAGGEPLVDF